MKHSLWMSGNQFSDFRYLGNAYNIDKKLFTDTVMIPEKSSKIRSITQDFIQIVRLEILQILHYLFGSTLS